MPLLFPSLSFMVMLTNTIIRKVEEHRDRDAVLCALMNTIGSMDVSGWRVVVARAMDLAWRRQGERTKSREEKFPPFHKTFLLFLPFRNTFLLDSQTSAVPLARDGA